MMAKKAAEKAKKEAIDRRKQEEEYRKIASIPEWKRQLIENRKAEDPKRQVSHIITVACIDYEFYGTFSIYDF